MRMHNVLKNCSHENHIRILHALYFKNVIPNRGIDVSGKKNHIHFIYNIKTFNLIFKYNSPHISTKPSSCSWIRLILPYERAISLIRRLFCNFLYYSVRHNQFSRQGVSGSVALSVPGSAGNAGVDPSILGVSVAAVRLTELVACIFLFAFLVSDLIIVLRKQDGEENKNHGVVNASTKCNSFVLDTIDKVFKYGDTNCEETVKKWLHSVMSSCDYFMKYDNKKICVGTTKHWYVHGYC
ncbi:hypothetical protein AGLY_003696 [Aphis glycines]|uniref:Uncharacterized protein n=1 Tax=Aphis glycines TaxID=307491 RepID=A0A6G0TZC4_APHGL|nr:hypothetical protein AGLY_003696 [Aphis glycines]